METAALVKVFGPRTMSDLSLQCAPKQTSADASERSWLCRAGRAWPRPLRRAILDRRHQEGDRHRRPPYGGELVKAEVIGEATLRVEATVAPSPKFLTSIRTAVQNAINAFRSSARRPPDRSARQADRCPRLLRRCSVSGPETGRQFAQSTPQPPIPADVSKAPFLDGTPRRKALGRGAFLTRCPGQALRCRHRQ